MEGDCVIQQQFAVVKCSILQTLRLNTLLTQVQDQSYKVYWQIREADWAEARGRNIGTPN